MTPPPSSPSTSATATPRVDCQARLRRWLIDGELPDSAAGVASCTRADLDAVLGKGESGSGRYSGQPREFTKHAPASGGSVRAVWNGDRVLLLVAEDIPVKDVDGLLGRLGAPEAEWPSRTSKMSWTIRDQVFAARGLTLSVASSLAEPPAPRRIVVAYLYEPTTVDRYVSELGGKDEWVRKFPVR